MYLHPADLGTVSECPALSASLHPGGIFPAGLYRDPVLYHLFAFCGDLPDLNAPDLCIHVCYLQATFRLRILGYALAIDDMHDLESDDTGATHYHGHHAKQTLTE